MLSRTAANLYWTGRYIERADFLARLLEATGRLSALPSTYGGDPTAWGGALAAAGVDDIYNGLHDEISEAAVVSFLTMSPDNPSSVRGCVERARSNARAVRTGLTREAWESLNSAWHEVLRLQALDA